LETQNLICIFVPNKNPYIMISLIAYYLLAGTIIGCGIEQVIRWSGQDFTWFERVQMVVLWPIASIVFAYHFIKGLLGKD